jgi:hypothetical protein
MANDPGRVEELFAAVNVFFLPPPRAWAVEWRAFRFLPDHREFVVKPAEREDKDVRRRAANDRSNARHRSIISSQALRDGDPVAEQPVP